jgi:hypothetical protein
VGEVTSDSRICVDVFPREAYEQRPRLFAALETAFPVKFQVCDSGDADAAVVFTTRTGRSEAVNGPTLTLLGDVQAEEAPVPIAFTDSGSVPRPFRGCTLTDSSTGQALPDTYDDWGEPLAMSPSGPVWMARADHQFVAASCPDELGPDAALRDQLTVGRFMALLPLVHFLRELLAAGSWEQPESKACFVFDDPNLHWWSYGYLDYRELAAHAEAHDYRVTAATIPLDQWYIHRPTARFLQAGAARVSFAVHGNNHTRDELGRVDDLDRASTLAAQALERTGAVRRAGAEIGPVMVPPHGACSAAMLEGCLRAGFDAVCAEWPYWWLADRHVSTALSGWTPFDRLAGLPVIPRLHVLASDRDDIPFRAFLGQPLVLYAHHTDLKDGLELLADRADEVRARGVDSWLSLGDIATDVFSAHRSGASMDVTLYSQRARIAVPEGVSEARFGYVGREPSETTLRFQLRNAPGQREIEPGQAVAVDSGEISVTVVATPSASSNGAGWPVRGAVRRLLTESRDRAAPVSSRIQARASRRTAASSQ